MNLALRAHESARAIGAANLNYRARRRAIVDSAYFSSQRFRIDDLSRTGNKFRANLQHGRA